VHDASLKRLRLVPADVVLNDDRSVPKVAGVYLVFFNGGFDLLNAICYFRCIADEPLALGRDVLLYIGASACLRARAVEHLTGSVERSSLRRRLRAIQLSYGAISKTETPGCCFADEIGLSKWMLNNVHFAFVTCFNFHDRERQLLNSVTSPFNLHHSHTQ
jgi:hypothetical protein